MTSEPSAERLGSDVVLRNGSTALARRWRERPLGTFPDFDDLELREAYAILATALDRRDAGWLTAEEVERLLACYGLRTARSEWATSPEEARETASRIGGTIALKALGPDVVHKTEVGGVALGLSEPDAIEDAARAITQRIESAGLSADGFVVQEMVEGGVEMLVGVAHDPLLGPVVAGWGGRDHRGAAQGYLCRYHADQRSRCSGDDPVAGNVPAPGWVPLRPQGRPRGLEDVVLRIDMLADNHPAIAEMDCNPDAPHRLHRALLHYRSASDDPHRSGRCGSAIPNYVACLSGARRSTER